VEFIRDFLQNFLLKFLILNIRVEKKEESMFRHNIEILDLPPKPFMIRLMDKVAKTYCFLWREKNSEYEFDITWKDLAQYFNKNVFRTSVKKLSSAGLLDYRENEEGIHIELVALDESKSA
jgi:hypothetical protein